MHSQSLVTFALQQLSCNQQELARQLGVSATQVSKWKKDEHISPDMERKLRDLTQLKDEDPNFVLWCGSLSEAKRWTELIEYLADQARESAETGYDTYLFDGDWTDFLCSRITDIFTLMGVAKPECFPTELDPSAVEDLECSDEELEQFSQSIQDNPYSRTIQEMFSALNDLYGFYAAYISDIMDDDALELEDTQACNIEPSLLDLAAAKIDIEKSFAPKAREFRVRTIDDYENWLNIVKSRAFRAGVPLRAELLELAHSPSGDLGHEAEAKSLGFRENQLHPDIYMNELLVGMRAIHQVLPVILKKLEIYDDFELDDSEFRVTSASSHKSDEAD
jgi:transcriptional regulator with XRE-family HTH domain